MSGGAGREGVPKLGVLVVDDDFRVANLHASYVGRVPEFEVVGIAHTAADAMRIAEQTDPDLVLLDEYLPDAPGSAIIRSLGAAVMMVSAANDTETLRRAITLGAINFLLKPFPPQMLADRLTAFARFRALLDNGDEGLDQTAVDRALGALRGGDSPPGAVPKGRSAVTADSIRDTLRTADGPLTAAAIATRTGVSRATAQRYLSDLVRGNRVELTLRYGTTGRPEHLFVWRNTQ
ncbi:response regulator [Kribbella hippodromi]|uniref:Transcriptional regulatory protein n=1 Tax=Kribbella hippodromi TaxID=434347 RepID=A0ABN2EAN5_9ACTN